MKIQNILRFAAGLVLVGFFVGACASKQKTPERTQESAPLLTQAEAIQRASQVQNLLYELEFDLTKSEQFSGKVTIRFDVLHTRHDLPLDFYDGQIQSVRLNGQALPIAYNKHQLILPKDQLSEGPTLVEIEFSRKYANDGSGLHQFIDPEDQARYVYTNLQPFDSSRVFPQFDQPDLKARYKMLVRAPKDWILSTSVMEEKIDADTDGAKVWRFPESALFSTYIWSLHGGPFKVWTDQAGSIPLRLMVRASLAKYVDAKMWFQYTKEGFQFFNEYFDYPYPYKKYDQLIVPEFNAGAMENVAAVTFSERFVPRGQMPRSQKLSLSNVILHEMAHMWFGNLVTMKWWDDLWLNESFATYLAFLAQSSMGEFKNETWLAFHNTKSWAYFEDELVTTHPIEAVVPDTNQATANFDGITYGKGAASLKQLSYYIGEDVFKKGTQNYIKKFAEKNTKLKDFMGALDEVTEKDLKTWQKLWLQTSGVNTVSVDYTCRENKVSDLSITQIPDGTDKLLRPHSLQVALLKTQGASYQVDQIFKVEITKSKTSVPEAIGKNCPEMVYPNYGDHAYIKVKLDAITIGHLKSGINQIEDPSLRKLFWASLWDMVVFAELSFEAYADLVVNGSLRQESDLYVTRDLLQTLVGRGIGTPSVMNYLRIKEGRTSKTYQTFLKNAEQLVWSRLTSLTPESELQQSFFSTFRGLAETPQAQKQLLQLLNGQVKLRGFNMDPDRRWEIIDRLAELGHPKASALIAAEGRNDKSFSGQLDKVAAEAALPNWSNKNVWIEKALSPDAQVSSATLRAAIGSLFPPTQDEFRNEFAPRFYEGLNQVLNHKDPYRAAYFASLAPNECAESVEPKMASFLATHSKLNPVLSKSLKVQNQQFERCRKVIALAREKRFG